MASFSIIQGGMGVGVSGWPLARAVSRRGQLGVVSGTGLAAVLARRLQTGDIGGHLRRALAKFPLPAIAQRILDKYFVEGGKREKDPFVLTPMPQVKESLAARELTVTANFVEVFLAKEGHTNAVGINYLEKIQFPHLTSLFGAMLAGVDYVLMGAGIPRVIPGVLDALAAGKPATYRIDIEHAKDADVSDNEEECCTTFDPALFCGGLAPHLARPRFLAIISSATLAMTLARKSNGQVDGFVVEGAIAGGHNAPPRGPMQLNERGEPLYGPRDVADLEKIRALKLPFWLAGGFGQPGKLAEAEALGASGIQVGTAFAFCEESGIDPEIKQRVLAESLSGAARVFTDPAASPTGFPLKVVQLPGTVSEPTVVASRERNCDLGYLRQTYRKEDGTLGYRCPAEPIDDYVRKGGRVEDTVGRKCLCNGLFATVGFAQLRPEGAEPPLVTAGDDVVNVHHFLRPGHKTYSAAEVIERLLESRIANPDGCQKPLNYDFQSSP